MAAPRTRDRWTWFGRSSVALVEAFGFHLSRVRGSHHLFVHPGIAELVNFQEVHGQAKPYQIRQFLKIVERHNLRLGGE